ncbi:hypothetical protein GCM10022271_10330 [Corallibacter vietnamensis]|uniref:Lycopene cyclase domain-containing protein n=1 Tax=Corallibacter vietnamensis TaxID=904130 RepID=A0ABP7H6P1_9FLAO
MKAYTYLLVDLACISIPLIASFYKKHAFYKDWKPFIKANLIIALLFLIWDALFVQKGIWGFNNTYLTGFYITNLPIEEILFFICIPFSCVFTYFSTIYLIKNNPLKNIQRYITLIVLLILLFTAIINYNKLYTSVTFFVTSAYLSIHLLKKTDLSYHYLSYILVLPFFFISNGILTGSFIVAPIVWYNDAENLGIRLGNIPIEDSIYGLLLIISNIDLYRYFKQKSHS